MALAPETVFSIMKNINTARRFIDRDSVAAHAYLREIMRYPLLTADEERQLSKRIQQGDRLALDRLVCANLRFVVSVANQYQGKTLTLMDLIDEGNIGLMRAAGTYGAQNEARFVTYASPFVHEAIQLALTEKDGMFNRGTKGFQHDTWVRQFVRHYEHEHEYPPSARDVSDGTGLPLHEVVSILYNTAEPKDIDDHDQTGGESIEQSIDHEDYCRQVNAYLSLLTPTERLIVEHQYGLNGRPQLELHKLALHIDLSYSQVRKLSSSAMKKMKELAQSDQK